MAEPEWKASDDKPPAKKVTPPPSASSKNASKSKAEPTGGTDRKPASRKPAGRPPALETQLTEFFVTVGTLVSMVNEADGLVIGANAQALGHAWAELAREDKRVKAALDKMLTGSAWGGVVMATGTVAMGIAANHGVFDNIPMFGGEPEAEGPPTGPPPTI